LPLSQLFLGGFLAAADKSIGLFNKVWLNVWLNVWLKVWLLLRRKPTFDFRIYLIFAFKVEASPLICKPYSRTLRKIIELLEE
jgi:hypothetical protein